MRTAVDSSRIAARALQFLGCGSARCTPSHRWGYLAARAAAGVTGSVTAPLSQAPFLPTGGASATSGNDGTSTLKFSVASDAAALGRRDGPLALYESLVETGELQEDANQRRVLEILNAVFHGAARRQSKGVYLYGSVGCGKTMAMDLFFSSMQSAGLRVERRHFHDFLNETHRKLHQQKKDGIDANGRLVKEDAGCGPVERVAQSIASGLDVLCFDEFAVTTIQDCVLMMPLFSYLFHHGVIVVATSNRAPDDLYTDGLNRHLYLPPFLESLRVNCKIHHLLSSIDYRSVQHLNSPDAGVFCWPHDPSFVDKWFQLAGDGDGDRGVLDISYGRSLQVPQLSTCRKVARFSFTDLCGTKGTNTGFFSADDYLFLARQVHTILIDDVPRLTVDDHNEARRFTLLVDSCYEHHVRLVCSMAATPQEILGNLSQLREMTLASLAGEDTAGCGDSDSSSSSSGVLQAIRRVKEGMAKRQREQEPGAAAPHLSAHQQSPMHVESATQVLSAEIQRAQSHGEGEDMAVWKQDGKGSHGPPQVSKSWDDRRRITAFTWESADPTAEAQTVKGVFTAAVASLQESGFAVERAISRLKEMQTAAFQDQHRIKHGLG